MEPSGGVRYAAVMAGVFAPGVELPSAGLLLPYERARLRTVVLSFVRLRSRRTRGLPPFPSEMITEILRALLLTTPQYGIDPVELLRWFWNREPTLDMEEREVDPNPTDPILRKRWNGMYHTSFEFFGMRYWCLKGNPVIRPPYLRDPTDVPTITWKDLSMVFIDHVAGSSMVHRMIDDDRKGVEGTAKWYPEDIDIFVQTTSAIVLFERWLHATFRSGIVYKDGSTASYESTGWQRRPPVRSVEHKWTCGRLKFNGIDDGKVLNDFDLEPAATHSKPPFNTVYANFTPTGPFIMHHVVPDRREFDRVWSGVLGFVKDEDLAEMRDRSTARVEKYRARIKNLEVRIDREGRYADAY